VIGRSKRDTTLVQARQDVDRLAAQLSRKIPGPSRTAFNTVGLEADNTRQVRAPLLVVSAAVALLLVISAVNVLGVLVARAAARRREIALRVALGASRLRVVRLSLAEGLTLALLGAVFGGLLARAARSVDPSLPIYEVQPLDAYLERARAVSRFMAILVAVFAGTALLLAAIGVYGVVAYAVLERRREFGVRRALGATSTDIAALVLLDGARLLGVGSAAGLAAAALGAQLLRDQLFGVSPTDALAYGLPLPVLALAALLACLWPARRAIAVPVVEVLRAE